MQLRLAVVMGADEELEQLVFYRELGERKEDMKDVKRRRS